MALDKVLSDIFDRNIERRFDSVEAEREAIAAAKAGDSEATVALLYAYAHALNKTVGRFRNAGGANATADHKEELRSLAVTGLYEAIHAFDPEAHDRLAAIVSQHLWHAVSQLNGTIAFTVPQRTLTRFYSILRKANDNVYEAAALAPKYEMSRETFFSVLSAVRDVDSYDGLTGADDEHGSATKGGQSAEGSRDIDARPIWDNSAAEEDALLVAAAFDAVDDTEERVCRLAYGFETYGDPVADAEIGHKLGMTRPTVQRRRSSALGKMRQALAVA